MAPWQEEKETTRGKRRFASVYWPVVSFENIWTVSSSDIEHHAPMAGRCYIIFEINCILTVKAYISFSVNHMTCVSDNFIVYMFWFHYVAHCLCIYLS